MSYPKYDFRYQVQHTTDVTSSLILEPWNELLKSWIHLNKPDTLLLQFQEAIKYNIGTHRYNPFVLHGIDNYPEFKDAIYEGLLDSWNTYPLQYNPNDGLHIGRIPGNIVLLPDEQFHLLDHIRTSGYCTLNINGEPIKTGIWMNRMARETFRLINFMRSITYP